jgi:hypothetical protein
MARQQFLVCSLDLYGVDERQPFPWVDIVASRTRKFFERIFITRFFRERGAALSDLEALEYWDLHQIQEDGEGDGRSKRTGDGRCRQRRHGNAPYR